MKHPKTKTPTATPTRSPRTLSAEPETCTIGLDLGDAQHAYGILDAGAKVLARGTVRNRIHALLDRHPELERPQFKDVFCKKGVAWMRRVKMPEPDRCLLDEELSLLSLLAEQIRHLEARIEAYNSEDVLAQQLRTLPGVGPILAAVMALEIDPIDRFRSAPKRCAYAGLVPSTYSSGGKTSHGRMLRFCSQWLKWAFIEITLLPTPSRRPGRRRGEGGNSPAKKIATRAF